MKLNKWFRRSFLRNFFVFWVQLSIGVCLVHAQSNVNEWIDLGLEFKKKGKRLDALEAFKSAINSDPKNPDGYFQLGFTLQNLKRFKEALDSYKNGVELNPDHKQQRTFTDKLRNI